MFTKKFALDMLERSIKTFAQTLAAALTTVMAAGGTLTDVNWSVAIGMALLAALYSVLTSVASSGINSEDSASLM